MFFRRRTNIIIAVLSIAAMLLCILAVSSYTAGTDEGCAPKSVRDVALFCNFNIHNDCFTTTLNTVNEQLEFTENRKQSLWTDLSLYCISPQCNVFAVSRLPGSTAASYCCRIICFFCFRLIIGYIFKKDGKKRLIYVLCRQLNQ